ncbi:uncharacterized protein LOC144346462 [Saccoglossus kowalevskii]
MWKYCAVVMLMMTVCVTAYQPTCYQCPGMWHNKLEDCPATWSCNKCEWKDACVTQIRHNDDHTLVYYKDCLDKEECLKKQNKNPMECYDEPIKVSHGKKCVFCCDEDYCNQFFGRDAIMVD